MAQDLETSALRCGNPECPVASDGRCIEGHSPVQSCPHFGKVIPIGLDAADTVLPFSKPAIALASAGTLSVEEAQTELRQSACRVVAIVGPFDAGKTSLIAGLYDLFQSGAVGQFEFASSLSLHAFEQAAHDSRAASRRDNPDQNRTPLGEVRFYHLGLVVRDASDRASLLLADRAGESYLFTRNDPDSAKEFPELARADVLTMLVDGARLASNEQRHNVRSEVRLTLQALIEAGVTRPWQRFGRRTASSALQPRPACISGACARSQPHHPRQQSLLDRPATLRHRHCRSTS